MGRDDKRASEPAGKRCTAFRCGYGAENPPEIVEGLKKYIDTHILGYTGPTEEYFDAVCGWMKRRNDWNIKKEEIVSTHGVVTALAVSVLAYTDPGRRRYHYAAGLLSVQNDH